MNRIRAINDGVLIERRNYSCNYGSRLKYAERLGLLYLRRDNGKFGTLMSEDSVGKRTILTASKLEISLAPNYDNYYDKLVKFSKHYEKMITKYYIIFM